jgi:hypothetical protein
MSGLEDRLTAAYLATAEFVREDAVPAEAPARLTVPGRRAASTGGPRNKRTRRVWGIAPIVAAAAVAAVAAILVTAGVVVPHVLSGLHPGARAHSGHHSRAHSVAISGLPEFVVVSTGTGLEVVQTATGHVTGQVSTPAGQIFSRVAGNGSDRTFYVATQQADLTATCRAYFYRFSLTAAGQPSALTPLPGTGQAGLPTALAASADGRKLAFSLTYCANGGATKIPLSQASGYIGMLDTARGKVTRHWTFALSEDYATAMALAPTGRLLAFSQYLPNGSAIMAKTLRTNMPSGTVDQASTVVGLHGVSSLSVGAAALYACISTDMSPDRVANQLGVYPDLATGHRAAVLHTWTGYEASCTLAPNLMYGHLLVAIETMRRHNQAVFVPMVIVRVLAVDVRTGRLTTLLTFSSPTNGAGIPTLIGW